MHGYPYCDIVNVAIPNRNIPVRISGSGIPVLLLHGYPLDSRMWDRLVPLLASDHLCIAPDLRGFGSSVEEAMSFSLSDLADDCSMLLSALQIRRPICVCGLSMGGYVAMQFVDRHPQQIAVVILTNTRANADDPMTVANRRATATRALVDGVPAAVLPMLDKLLSPSTQATQQQLVDLVRSMMLSTRSSTIAWAQLAMAVREDFLNKLHRWDMPVTCVAGREDTIVPLEAMRQMAAEFSGSELQIVENSAHLTPLECPNEFAKIVRKSTFAIRGS